MGLTVGGSDQAPSSGTTSYDSGMGGKAMRTGSGTMSSPGMLTPAWASSM